MRYVFTGGETFPLTLPFTDKPLPGRRWGLLGGLVQGTDEGRVEVVETYDSGAVNPAKKLASALVGPDGGGAVLPHGPAAYTSAPGLGLVVLTVGAPGPLAGYLDYTFRDEQV